MKSNRMIIFCLALFLSLAYVIGMNCQYAKAQDKEYVVGFVGPMSGPNADTGIRGKNAVEMRLEEANSQGGVQIGGLRYKLRLVVGDTQGKVDVAATAIQRIIERDGVDLVLGGMLSSPTLAMINIAERLQTPFVIVGANSIKISQKIRESRFRYVYQGDPTSDERSFADATSVLELVKPQTVYVVSQDTDAGRDTVANFKRVISAANVKVTDEYVAPGTSNYSTTLVKIQSMKPDVIYAFLTGSEIYSFAEQRYSAGIGSVFYGATSTPASDLYIKTIGADKANKTLANVVWVPIGKEAEAFAARYEKLYGSSVGDLEAHGYDCASLVLDALAKSKSPAKADVAAALLKVNINGLRGHQTFREEDHTIPGLSFVICQIQGGKYVPVWPSSVARGKLLR